MAQRKKRPGRQRAAERGLLGACAGTRLCWYKAVLAVAARALVLVLRSQAYAGAIEDLGMVALGI
jgi:hypothetical protein